MLFGLLSLSRKWNSGFQGSNLLLPKNRFAEFNNLFCSDKRVSRRRNTFESSILLFFFSASVVQLLTVSFNLENKVKLEQIAIERSASAASATSAASAHQQHQCISSISASAASVHQRISRISASALSAASAQKQH